MSSGFISEAEIAANKAKRQEEWEKVRQPNEPLELQEEPYDSRSLYEKLKEQKDKKDYDYEEAHKLKNLIRGLDDDEVDFLDVVDKAKANAEHKQHLEESKELREFREQVANMQEKNMDSKIQAEIAKPKVTKISTRPSQKSILSGMVRKRAAPSSSASSSATVSSPAASSSSSPSKTASSAAATSSAEATSKSPPIVVEPRNASKPISTPASVGLRCIGLLPGVGKYHESSDSDKSTDTEDDYDFCDYDWLGRSIKRNKCDGSGGGDHTGHQH